MTVVEDLGNGLGDEEDFRPVAADDQQETVCNLMVVVDRRIMKGIGKPLKGGGARAHLKQELPELFLRQDGRHGGNVWIGGTRPCGIQEKVRQRTKLL